MRTGRLTSKQLHRPSSAVIVGCYGPSGGKINFNRFHDYKIQSPGRQSHQQLHLRPITEEQGDFTHRHIDSQHSCHLNSFPSCPLFQKEDPVLSHQACLSVLPCHWRAAVPLAVSFWPDRK